MRKCSSGLVENKQCVDTDVCCLVGRAVFTLISQLRQTTEAKKVSVCRRFCLCFSGCAQTAEDVKMLWMALYKSAWF